MTNKEEKKLPQIIDGKKISQEIKDELKEKVAALKQEGKRQHWLSFRLETTPPPVFM